MFFLNPFSFSCDAMSMFQKRGRKVKLEQSIVSGLPEGVNVKWSLHAHLQQKSARLSWSELKESKLGLHCSRRSSKCAGPKIQLPCLVSLLIHVRAGAAWPHLTWTYFPLAQSLIEPTLHHQQLHCWCQPSQDAAAMSCLDLFILITSIFRRKEYTIWTKGLLIYVHTKRIAFFNVNFVWGKRLATGIC